jgi:hypothetical protein
LDSMMLSPSEIGRVWRRRRSSSQARARNLDPSSPATR